MQRRMKPQRREIKIAFESQSFGVDLSRQTHEASASVGEQPQTATELEIFIFHRFSIAPNKHFSSAFPGFFTPPESICH